MELLVATALIGVIALAAAAFSKDIFAVQHRLTTEYDLRMEGLRAMEEIREGFSSGGTRYGGVRQAEEVVVLAGERGFPSHWTKRLWCTAGWSRTASSPVPWTAALRKFTSDR